MVTHAYPPLCDTSIRMSGTTPAVQVERLAPTPFKPYSGCGCVSMGENRAFLIGNNNASEEDWCYIATLTKEGSERSLSMEPLKVPFDRLDGCSAVRVGAAVYIYGDGPSSKGPQYGTLRVYAIDTGVWKEETRRGEQ
ncbi:hypothetical protein KIPB_015208, partial [Kipferlia bialata]|eukprot:g15208.t1